MYIEDSKTHITALPFQILEHGGTVILRRGNKQLFLSGANALETILMLLSHTSGTSNSLSFLIQLFAPVRKDEIKALIEELLKIKFLVPAGSVDYDINDETPEQVFFWENTLGSKTKEFDEIYLVGLNALSISLHTNLIECGLPIKGIIGDPLLNQELENESFSPILLNNLDLNKKGILIIGCLPFGGQALLLQWNLRCIKSKVSFLPVWIDDQKGYIGPLNLPFKTPCLNCLRMRQNAHLKDFTLWRHYENSAHSAQDIAAVHPKMISLLTNLVALELINYENFGIKKLNSGLIKTDFNNSETKWERILKVPRCDHCSTLNLHSTKSV